MTYKIKKKNRFERSLSSSDTIKLMELKKIAKGTKIKVTPTRFSKVRFKGAGFNAVRMIGDNVSPVSPKMQLKAMVTLSKRKNK